MPKPSTQCLLVVWTLLLAFAPGCGSAARVASEPSPDLTSAPTSDSVRPSGGDEATEEKTIVFDFTKGLLGWEGNHSIRDMKSTPEGLSFRCIGRDPYLWGLPRDYPEDRHVVVTVRMKSTGDTAGEVFFGPTFTAGNSATFSVTPDGEWHEYKVLLPPMGQGARLRLDPSDGPGDVTVAWIRVRPLPAPPSLDLLRRDNTMDDRLLIGFEPKEGLDPATFERDTNRPEQTLRTEIVEGGADGSGHALRVEIPDFDLWETWGIHLESAPADDYDYMVFWAKGDERTDSLAVEWRERDGSRWITAVDLAPEWKRYIVRKGDFTYWHRSVTGTSRGYADDALDYTQVEQFRFGLAGSHTFVPKGRHVYWIDEVGVANDPYKATLDEYESRIFSLKRDPAPFQAKHIVRSGYLEVRHDGRRLGGIELRVGERPMGRANAFDYIVYESDSGPAVLDPDAMDLVVFPTEKGGLRLEGALTDTDGVEWTLRQTIAPGAKPGSVVVEAELRTSSDRAVYHLPWLMVFPGLDSFGETKRQGLFAGLEYLADEPSSSDKDVRGPKANRRLPERHKITFPLMAIEHDGAYIALSWDDAPAIAALFDSPDRIYGAGGHLMGLVSPPVGPQRLENTILAYDPMRIAGGTTLRARATLLGGHGDSVVEPVRAWVELNGLPELPRFEGGFEAASRLMAKGWIDSDLYRDGQWRHAIWHDVFGFQPAADAPAFMARLAEDLAPSDPALSNRLRQTIARGLQELPPDTAFTETIGHVRFPFTALLFGNLDEYISRNRKHAYNLLSEYDDDGFVRYRPKEGKTDLATTHWADHANGFAAQIVQRILVGATLADDEDLMREALAALDRLAIYDKTVPRGAQTWEMPIHTPDILGSAHLVEVYTLGYELTGKTEYLERARYWAWTGVPFLYLVPPTEGETGPYATIAVLGATQWEAPYWIGLPVQWCGLVYASALHRLARHDPDGLWETLAKGITLSGLRQTFPETDAERQGLLPDYFHLKAQVSDGPAINPGTLQARLLETYDRGTLYDFRVLAGGSVRLHAPCAVERLVEEDNAIRLALAGFGERSYSILLSGVKQAPRAVEFVADARPNTAVAAPVWVHNPTLNTLAIQLRGPADIRIRGPLR